jgi:hypothetical protein
MAGITVAGLVVIIASRHISADERSRVIGFIPLFIVNVGFCSLYALGAIIMGAAFLSPSCSSHRPSCR